MLGRGAESRLSSSSLSSSVASSEASGVAACSEVLPSTSCSFFCVGALGSKLSSSEEDSEAVASGFAFRFPARDAVGLWDLAAGERAFCIFAAWFGSTVAPARRRCWSRILSFLALRRSLNFWRRVSSWVFLAEMRSSSCWLSFSRVLLCDSYFVVRSRISLSRSVLRWTAVPHQLMESISSFSSRLSWISPSFWVMPEILFRKWMVRESSAMVAFISSFSTE